jgi:hypothetical protein
MMLLRAFATGFGEGWAEARSPDFLPFLNATIVFAAGLGTVAALAG